MYLRGNNCRRQLSPLTKAGGKRPRWKLLKGRSSEEGPKEVPLRSLEGGCSGAAGVGAVRLALQLLENLQAAFSCCYHAGRNW